MPARNAENDKGLHLVNGQIQTDGFGGDCVIADGLDRAALLAVDEVHDDDQREQHQRKAKAQRGELAGNACTLCARDNKVTVDGVHAVAEHGKVRHAVHQLNVEAVENRADDLAEGQRHDGQIVAAQPQDRNTDQKAEDTGHQTADDDAHKHQ